MLDPHAEVVPSLRVRRTPDEEDDVLSGRKRCIDEEPVLPVRRRLSEPSLELIG
jgi:hypothetical protein